MNVTSKIELNEDGFGTFNPEVIAMLLNSIRDFFASVGVESMKPIVIVHDPTGPECCAIPNEEKHLIKLSTGGDFWCQWVYQFAHEYCHHLIDGGLVRQTVGLRWLEESICHVASYVCLDNFARICAQRVDLCGNVKQIVDYLEGMMCESGKILYEPYIHNIQKLNPIVPIPNECYISLHTYIQEKRNKLESEYFVCGYIYISRALFPHFYNNKNLWKILPELKDTRQWGSVEELYEHLEHHVKDDYRQSLNDMIGCLI